jgi:hypothetical protein
MLLHKHKVQSEKKPAPRLSRFTVMIVRDVGKVRSFKISSRILFCTSLLIALFILAFFLVMSKYLDELRTNRSQSECLKQLQQEIENTKSALKRSKQHFALLESYINHSKVGNEKPAPAAGLEREKPTNARSAAIGNASDKKVLVESKEKSADIKDLVIKKEETSLTVSFNLVNVRGKKSPISGYVHIIAMDEQIVPPRVWTYPEVAERNGIPINYKEGQLFSIQNFKTIRGKYTLEESQSFSSMRALVYNEAGELILNKDLM